eukprot:NODE_1621_length_2417_cov_4.647598.p2 GENE.NODE_1621_length_2417_cov_4.647598~~NODE_1621_length_2417_cov_4.647598.p2  ORF type:complete len:121 (-),score=0.81 NODE_1621_length_2417_cov_4.647598:983-1345(-)
MDMFARYTEKMHGNKNCADKSGSTIHLSVIFTSTLHLEQHTLRQATPVGYPLRIRSADLHILPRLLPLSVTSLPPRTCETMLNMRGLDACNDNSRGECANIFSQVSNRCKHFTHKAARVG